MIASYVRLRRRHPIDYCLDPHQPVKATPPSNLLRIWTRRLVRPSGAAGSPIARQCSSVTRVQAIMNVTFGQVFGHITRKGGSFRASSPSEL